MLDRISWRSATISYALITALCVMALASAYTAQYAFNLHPCHLCYYHRYIYMAIAGGSFLITLLKWRPLRFLLAAGVLLSMLAGIGLAAYHTAIEREWVEPPKACLNAYMDGNSLEEVKYEIMHEPVVPCHVVKWRFLGLSMTEYSLLFFLLLTLLGCQGFGHLRRQRCYDPYSGVS